MGYPTVFLDIETLPAQTALHGLVRELFGRRERTTTFEQYLAATSLDGNFGRIYCIGYALDRGPVTVIAGDEKEMLEQFWQLARTAGLFVGHNIIDFDMRFILKRSIILAVKPTIAISFARYRASPMFDTMREWERWAHGASISLGTLGRILGVGPSKGPYDGSDVARLYSEGRTEEIKRYCESDVALTRAVYYKMTFQENA